MKVILHIRDDVRNEGVFDRSVASVVAVASGDGYETATTKDAVSAIMGGRVVLEHVRRRRVYRVRSWMRFHGATGGVGRHVHHDRETKRSTGSVLPYGSQSCGSCTTEPKR